MFIHNASYYFAIDCSPNVFPHGREPITHLDLHIGISTIERFEPTNEYVQEYQDAMLKKIDDMKQQLTILSKKSCVLRLQG